MKQGMKISIVALLLLATGSVQAQNGATDPPSARSWQVRCSTVDRTLPRVAIKAYQLKLPEQQLSSTLKINR